MKNCPSSQKGPPHDFDAHRPCSSPPHRPGCRILPGADARTDWRSSTARPRLRVPSAALTARRPGRRRAGVAAGTHESGHPTGRRRRRRVRRRHGEGGQAVPEPQRPERHRRRSTTPPSLALGLTTNPLYGLKQGATGDAVTQLQQRLIELGIAVPGGADGAFGPGTTTAVKQFQAGVGLLQVGCRQCRHGGRARCRQHAGRHPGPARRRRQRRRRRPSHVGAQGRRPRRRRQAAPAAVDRGRLLDGRRCRRHLRCAHGERARVVPAVGRARGDACRRRRRR